MDVVLWEERRPEGEALHEEELGGEELLVAHLQVHVVVVFLNLSTLLIDLGN